MGKQKKLGSIIPVTEKEAGKQVYRFQVSGWSNGNFITVTVDANCVEKAARIGFDLLGVEAVHIFSWLGMGEVSLHYKKGERGKAVLVE